MDLKVDTEIQDTGIPEDPVSPPPFRLDGTAEDKQPPDIKEYYSGTKRCAVHSTSAVRKLPKFHQMCTNDITDTSEDPHSHSITDQVVLKTDDNNEDEDDKELEALALKSVPVDIATVKQNTLVAVERIVGCKPLEEVSEVTAPISRSPLSPSEVEAIIREYKDLLRNNGHGDGQAGDGSVNKYPRYMRMLFDNAVFITRAELFEKEALSKAVMFFTKLAFEKARDGKTSAKKHFSNFMHGFTDFVELATP